MTCGQKNWWDQINVYGWMQAGITVNNHGNANSYGTSESPACRKQDIYSGNSYLFISEQHADMKLTQFWLGMNKVIDTTCGFDWGFQMDYIYGVDAQYTQNFGDHSFDYDWGHGDYYSSIGQLFGEVGYYNLKFKAGKFAPGMIHETLPAPMTFFNTGAFLNYNTPLTVNGAVAEYKANDCLTFSGGWTAGAHSTFDNRFGDNAFLGSVILKTSRATALRYGIFCNDVHGDPATAPIYKRNYNSGTELTQTLIFTYNINRCWFYMIEGLYLDNDYNTYSANAYGINQHFIYTINPKWSVGLRHEWHRAENTLFALPSVPGQMFGEAGDLYALTLGANWNVSSKIIIRPELRYDWTNYENGWKPFGGDDGTGNGRMSEQLSGGGSLIVKF